MLRLPPATGHWRSETDLSKAGFVFAATGAKYTSLARQAAASVRAVHPHLPIDFFTDQELDQAEFDIVHKLEEPGFRPKFEAITRSRFEHTIYLDADLFVVADISDLFWLLSKYDLVAAQVEGRNASWARQIFRSELPNAFPQINSGVMAIRKNERTERLMKQVQFAIKQYDLKMDQVALRELLWLSDVSVYIMPGEYNVRSVSHVVGRTYASSAPRVLHSSKFHKNMRNGKVPTPRQIYGLWTMRKVRKSIKADKQLSNSISEPQKANE